jgi:hypothetical protein
LGTHSNSGNAAVLQAGVMSNSVPFIVNTLQITSIAPNSGGPGTPVTIIGNGFGDTQGNGAVWLGSTSGDIISWSNTQVVAAVATDALTGVARIQQNDIWSNSVTFTVPNSGPMLTLSPNMLNLVTGETHNIQALNASGQSVTGLTWVSSDSHIVTLSTDDPPILTALNTGHVTITAGTASADVNVTAGPPPLGTVIWSNPGDGSGVVSVVPAVPSLGGVADVFAFNADGTVSAIRSDGTTAWTAQLPGGATNAIADFQGGLIVGTTNPDGSLNALTKLDGMTGQPYPTVPLISGVIPSADADGTVFTTVTNGNLATPWLTSSSLIGIDPIPGSQKFGIPLTKSTITFNGLPSDCQFPNFAITWDCWIGAGFTVHNYPGMIAGDGYSYWAYGYANVAATATGQGSLVTDTINNDAHLMLVRVAPDGTSNQIDIKDWITQAQLQCTPGGCVYAGNPQLPAVYLSSMITNSDTGVIFSWEETYTPGYDATYWLAVTAGTNATVTQENIPGQADPIVPILQAQDGTFIGTVGIGPKSLRLT